MWDTCVTPGQWVGVINSGHMRDKAAYAYRGDKSVQGRKERTHPMQLHMGDLSSKGTPVISGAEVKKKQQAYVRDARALLVHDLRSLNGIFNRGRCCPLSARQTICP